MGSFLLYFLFNFFGKLSQYNTSGFSINSDNVLMVSTHKSTIISLTC